MFSPCPPSPPVVTLSLSHQPEESLKEDFLFPMSNRLSYASSPESDAEMRSHSMYDDNDASPTPVRRPMVRSNSDPSIATLENIPGIPPYQAPPSYMREGKHVSIGGSCQRGSCQRGSCQNVSMKLSFQVLLCQNKSNYLLAAIMTPVFRY